MYVDRVRAVVERAVSRDERSCHKVNMRSVKGTIGKRCELLSSAQTHVTVSRAFVELAVREREFLRHVQDSGRPALKVQPGHIGIYVESRRGGASAIYENVGGWWVTGITRNNGPA